MWMVHLGKMILKHKMPAVPFIDSEGSATEHAMEIGGFTVKLIQWLQDFAQSLLEYWESGAYKRGRETSKVDLYRNQRFKSMASSAGDRRGTIAYV